MRVTNGGGEAMFVAPRLTMRPPRRASVSVEGDSSREPSVESDRSHLPVLITGICGRLGRRLARHLHRERPVIGIDRRSFEDKPKDIVHHQVDIRRKKTQDVFRHERLAAVVHLGVMHDPRVDQAEHHSWNVVGLQRLLEYVAHYDVPKLVVLSSANVYGPRPDNPQFLTEDAPLLGGASFSEIRDLIEVDMLAQSFFWKRPRTETVILRPVHILGAVRNAPSNYLRLPVIPTLLGFDPMVQVIHQDDVVSAIARALMPGARGIYNIAGPPPLPLSRLVGMTGRTRVAVPHGIAQGVVRKLWQYRATSFPAPEIDHIRYVCMVDDTRARTDLGYAHTHDITQTVAAIDDVF
ncbi:NAD-dependent epimerase/dehydratase family protein [Polyangium mundeleinium]|uniref:NAD-dependent epimerase/dehydratase family protein n=1 Tax=Polyangium mundeleinium TaxID=2995306 RepID=A0ABT5EMH7_9BACT|nr:NAD-dependent epimerase/dehydratase family protein [Polyangium mundeleinium]MDC0742674.1 NAD-dependent epimerase/dehydratase family protein [Polyangium mundeleinium]